MARHGQSAGGRTLLGSSVAMAMATACTSLPPLPDPLEAGWKGQKVCERLHEDKSQRVLRCTFEPNVGHERHFHAPHFGYAIAGGSVQIEDDRGIRNVTLATGSHFSSDGVAWHEIMNTGETTIIYLIVEHK